MQEDVAERCGNIIQKTEHCVSILNTSILHLSCDMLLVSIDSFLPLGTVREYLFGSKGQICLSWNPGGEGNVGLCSSTEGTVLP